MRKNILWLLAVVVLLGASCAKKTESAAGDLKQSPSAGAPGPGGFEARVAERMELRKLPYRLLWPANYQKGSGQKYPLLVFLHGIGERGTDNEKQLAWGKEFFLGASREFNSFVMVPQCPPDDVWARFGQNTRTNPTYSERPTVAMSMVLETIENLKKEHPIDGSRVYISGLSMGGYGTWDAITRRPDLFAAAAPICGGGDLSKAPALAKMPIWDFHGDKDEAVPVARSRELIEAIKKAGGNPKYTEYPGVGHDSWVQAFKEPGLLNWLYGKSR